MKKELSAYLDLLRIAAALVVFAGHLSWRQLSGDFLWQFDPYGHSAVIVFFVLSGFVIQFSADQKEKSLLDYSVARFARLYSVVLPALILTVICDWIGTHHNPGVYHMERETMPFFRVSLGILFLTQSWQGIPLLSDVAFWSLPYEFWYYVIFASAIFFKGWWRVALIGLTSIVAGPGILLLFPIWLIGVFAYRLRNRTIPWPKAVWALSGAAIVIVLYANKHPTEPHSPFLPQVWSAWDYVLGVLLAANILAASRIEFGLTAIKRQIAELAGMTFALYLFHLPILQLIAAYTPTGILPSVRGIGGTVVVFSSVYILSFITEKQKKRWRGLFRWLFTMRLRESLPVSAQ